LGRCVRRVPECETTTVARRVLVLLAVCTVVTVVATAVVLVLPQRRDSLRGVDAVVVLAGERNRLGAGLDAVRRSGASTLVISNGTTHGWRAANRLCGAVQPTRVLCPSPRTDDTRGEARMIAGLVRANGWRSIAVVSSNYHVMRAGMLVDRCTTARVRAWSAPAHRWSPGAWVAAVLEWPKLALAAVRRSC